MGSYIRDPSLYHYRNACSRSRQNMPYKKCTIDYAVIISEVECLLIKYFDRATTGQQYKAMPSSMYELVILANNML